MQKLLHLILSLKGRTSLLLSTWEVIHTKLEHIKLRHLKMNQKKKKKNFTKNKIIKKIKFMYNINNQN